MRPASSHCSGSSAPGSTASVNGLLRVNGSAAGPLLGKLAGTAVIHFSITRDGVPTTTDVTVATTATADNTGIGDDTPKLLDARNAPTFATAQEFVDRLSQIITLGVVHYDVAQKVFTVKISFTDVPLFSVDLPTDFKLDLSPLANIQSDTHLIIDASGGISLTLGFDLSETPAGSS